MKVLIFASGKDTGGVAIGLKQAFDRFGEGWDVRTVRFGNNYIRYPADITYTSSNAAEVERLFNEADVVHMMQKTTFASRYPGFERKPKVLHQHGTLFRDNHVAIRQWAKDHRVQQLVSTIDLLVYGEELIWLPSPVNVDELSSMRGKRQPGKIRLGHAPTSRELKGTEAYLKAVEQLGDRVTSDLIEGVPWDVCLKRKSKVDIFFDQIMFGYGMNAIEAWAMGIPVISGTDDWRITKLFRKTLGYLPYHPASRSDIADRLMELVEDRALREQVAERGRAHVADHHDERVVVRRLKEIYERAVEKAQ